MLNSDYLAEKCRTALDSLTGDSPERTLQERVASAWFEIKLGAGVGESHPVELPGPLADAFLELAAHVTGHPGDPPFRSRSQEALQSLAVSMAAFCGTVLGWDACADELDAD